MIYLLVFDRALADAIVEAEYPSEGPQYLEKIIQASFDIPAPRPEDLRDQLLRHIERICGAPSADDLLDFMNIFYDVVAPQIRSPRDVVRVTNALSVTWPAIGAEVDRADMIGLETLRLLRPEVYRGIKGNKDRLTGGGDRGNLRYSEDQKKDYDAFLLGNVDAKDKDQLREALKRLFPRLQSVWGNLSYGDDSIAGWERRRRLCAAPWFDVYFRLSLGNDVLRKDEIDTLVRRAGDGAFVKDSLLGAIDVLRPGGGTKAALILDELNLHADSVADVDVQPLLTAIFGIADRLMVPADQAKAFSIGDNYLRIHWLLRRLTLTRFDLRARSAILLAASENASIGWLVDLSASTDAAHQSREGKEPRPAHELITTEEDANILRSRALEGIRVAAASGALVANRRLAHMLFRWRELAGDDGEEVRHWTKSKLENDRNVVAFAERFTTHGWSHSVSDRVAQRMTVVHTEGLDSIVDAQFFRERAKTLLSDKTLSNEDRAVLSEFEAAWSRQEKSSRR
ncbi:P-loop NTPase fold protein [Bradyrhizobium sp. HKCCYLRH1062]|uniref:P-loop NTPase fold protein n=1 Tax=unclassified Bradyrhizobium TaxID=2631580 RepID=UPI003EB774E5